MSDALWPCGLHSLWNSPGQNSLLQGIFPTQGSNPCLLHCRQILYQLNYKGNPRIQEWVAHPFFSGSSWPRNWTGVSCIAGRFFTNWAIREAHILKEMAYFGVILKFMFKYIYSVQVSRSVVSDSLRPNGLEHSRLPCPSPTPRAYSNSCPLSRWCHPTFPSSVVPFSSCLQSFWNF